MRLSPGYPPKREGSLQVFTLDYVELFYAPTRRLIEKFEQDPVLQVNYETYQEHVDLLVMTNSNVLYCRSEQARFGRLQVHFFAIQYCFTVILYIIIAIYFPILLIF